MKIFFDFDDVLFNTKKFKEDYFQIFKAQGVSKEIFDECYYNPFDSGNIRNYDPAEHIRRICERVRINRDIFDEEVLRFLEDTSLYVFDDVVRVISNFKPDQLTIISFSETQFQKAKIYNSGIFDFFGNIKITDNMKGKAVLEMIKDGGIYSNQKIFFVDDRVAQIEDVKKICPQVVTVLCQRIDGRYNDKQNEFCDYEVSNLEELESLIKDGHPRD